MEETKNEMKIHINVQNSAKKQSNPLPPHANSFRTVKSSNVTANSSKWYELTNGVTRNANKIKNFTIFYNTFVPINYFLFNYRATNGN